MRDRDAAAPTTERQPLMRFLVRMNVRLPTDIQADVRTELLAAEKATALALQRDGRWEHLWRVAGRYENVSIFNVCGPDELHQLVSNLPLFPYMDIQVTSLAVHPSSLEAQDPTGSAGPV